MEAIAAIGRPEFFARSVGKQAFAAQGLQGLTDTRSIGSVAHLLGFCPPRVHSSSSLFSEHETSELVSSSCGGAGGRHWKGK